MTQKEYDFRRSELDVQVAEVKLKQAAEKLRTEKIKHEAELQQKLHDLEVDIALARATLEKEKAFMALNKSDLERGFDA